MTLDELILAEVAAGHADPAVIAVRVLARMDDDEIHANFAPLLADRARLTITRSRMITRAGRTIQAGRSKWKRALTEFDIPVPVVGKVLRDCTADDLDALVAYYVDSASRSMGLADHYAAYAVAMRACGASTLGEIDVSDLRVAA